MVVARSCRRDSRRRLSPFSNFKALKGARWENEAQTGEKTALFYIQSRYTTRRRSKILPSVAQTIGQGETSSGSCCTFVATWPLFAGTDGENFLFSSSSLHRHIIGGAFAPFFNSTFFERLCCVYVRPPWLSTEVACHSSCRLQTIIPTASAIHMHARF